MRYLGVDYGTKRVGLAVADDELRLPLPLRSASVASLDEAVSAVAAAAIAEQADVIVVGLPRRLQGTGSAGETEQAVAKFVSALPERVAARVVTEDERLTTAAALSERRAAGVSTKKFDRDAVAAANILESYLARH